MGWLSADGPRRTPSLIVVGSTINGATAPAGKVVVRRRKRRGIVAGESHGSSGV